MLISICIPTYNRPENLLDCLNPLSLQANKNFDVCTSDNCSKKILEILLSHIKKN